MTDTRHWTFGDLAAYLNEHGLSIRAGTTRAPRLRWWAELRSDARDRPIAKAVAETLHEALARAVERLEAPLER